MVVIVVDRPQPGSQLLVAIDRVANQVTDVRNLRIGDRATEMKSTTPVTLRLTAPERACLPPPLPCPCQPSG